MSPRFLALSLIAAASLAMPLAGQSPDPSAARVLVNTDKQGLALEGHDPVAFFTEGRPVKGNPAHTATWQGATYRFSSAEHRDAFAAEPAKYAPAFGGYCAYGASRGYAASVEIDTWQIVDGRLILNYSQSVKRRFNEDRAGYLQKADREWPGVIAKEGRRAGD